MPNSWRESLRAEPIPWLLEPENLAVRYSTLRDLLDRPANHPDVLQAQAADYLLSRQLPDGSWPLDHT